MEARKINVVSTKTNSRKTFMSTATTLAELKEEMTRNGIDHSDVCFIEGLTRTEMKDDSSILPTTVRYTDPDSGEEKVTNELVFILTTPNKKIKSGMPMSREEAYMAIKANHLEAECLRVYGKNFTQVSTGLLESLVEANKLKGDDKEPQGDASNAQSGHACHGKIEDSGARKAILCLIGILTDYDIVDCADMDKVHECLDSEDSSTGCEEKEAVGQEPESLESDLPKGMIEGIVNNDWL